MYGGGEGDNGVAAEHSNLFALEKNLNYRSYWKDCKTSKNKITTNLPLPKNNTAVLAPPKTTSQKVVQKDKLTRR